MDSPAPAALPCRDSTRMGRILSGIEPRLTTARRLLRDPDAAADVVQSAFEKVLRYCEQSRDGARPSTGMHRIVVNEAFMWLRRETWHAPPPLDPDGSRALRGTGCGVSEAALSRRRSGTRSRGTMKFRSPSARREARCAELRGERPAVQWGWRVPENDQVIPGVGEERS